MQSWPYVCLLSAAHTCTRKLQTQQWLPTALGVMSNVPDAAHRVLGGLLLPPPASVFPAPLTLLSLVPLVSLQLHLFVTEPEPKNIPVLGTVSRFLLIL